MKTADLKRAAPWTKPAALAVATLVLALTATGCSPECVDAYDCRSDNGQPPAGEQWVCRDEKCDTAPLDGEPPPVDAGTDAGTDDAGTDAGVDAGTDAGVDPCIPAPHDAKLGTLTLQAGFTSAESVALPDDVVTVTSTPGPTYSLYALRGGGKDAALSSLGTWPDLQTANSKLYDVVTAADRAGTPMVFANGYLAYDGKRLAAGYTTSSTGFAGNLAVYDVATPAESTYVSAASNFTADAFVRGGTTAFLVNGAALGDTAGGLGIYALVTSREPFVTSKLANFPEGTAGSGVTHVAENDIAVLGYFASAGNKAHAVPPTVVADALTSGTPFALADQPVIDVGSNANASSTFGEGVAFNRGAYNASFEFVSTDVSRFALTFGIGGPQTVTIGERVPVLTYDTTQCTAVELMAPLGSDLLVGLRDKNGRRLVRIQQAP